MLHAEQLSCGYTTKAVVSKVTLAMKPGDFTCLLGKNGCGKSALLKTLAGLLAPRAGQLLLDGHTLPHRASPAQRSLIAYVPQASVPVFAFRTLDLVLLGQASKWGLFGSPTKAHWKTASDAMERVGILHLSERPCTELSGGERQLVLIARALAQEARYLLLDEPTASLDLGNQIKVLKLLRSLADEGMAILMACHDPDHALRVASQVAFITEGRLSEAGPPLVTLNASRLEAIYGVPFIREDLHPREGLPIPLCAPLFD